jgi:DNA polymerase III sliding clamp (beta) subunit (PCNA family)
MKFSVLRKQLKALSRFSAIKDIRYYLQGIHVVQNNRGTYLESTNGHMLGRLLIDSDYVENHSKVIIPLDAVKALSAIGKKGNEILHFTVEGQKITVIEPDNSTRVFSATDGCFPDTDRIIPMIVKEEDIKPSSYNISYLMAFYDADTDLRGSKANSCNVSVKQRGNDSGIVSIGADLQFVGIIMPMRDGDYARVPEWCYLPSVKAVETETATI